MRPSKEKYLTEYNKYKDVKIELHEVYSRKSKESEKVIILEIDEENQMARIKNIKTEHIQTKTLHWCRKHLLV